MTRQQPLHARENDIHQEVWQLLPWYLNGTLGPRELVDVEAHLPHCLECQEEAERCRTTAATVRDEHKITWAPSHAHFSALMAHIDASEARQSSGEQSWWANGRNRLLRYRLWLGESPRPVQWTVAFQGALVIVLAVALSWQPRPAPPQLYQTETSASEPIPTGHVHLRMAFAEDTTERELRTLLAGIKATIVQGPSSVGVYTVDLLEDHPAPEKIAQVLGLACADPKVRFAERVSTDSVP